MWLGSFMGLQFFITNFGLLKSGADIEAIIGKLIGSLMWFGICIYLLNNGADFIDSVGTGVMQKFMPDWVSPGYILAAIGGVVGLLLSTIGLTGLTVLGTGSPIIAIVVIIVLLVVVGVSLGLAMKIFMLKLELGLIVMLAPLSFAFLGLNALKDQGIAPFKALISLVYRAVLLGVICVAFKEVSMTTEAALNAINWGEDWTAYVSKAEIMLASVFAYPMLGYLVFKSDSIAASLASGSTNMGTADVAGAVAAGVAAGSVAGAAASAIGANPAQSMSNFLQSISSGSGTSVSNAGGVGSGGGAGSSGSGPNALASLGPAPKPSPTPASPYATGSKGQPLPPQTDSSASSDGGEGTTPIESPTPSGTGKSATPDNSSVASGSGKNAEIGGGGGDMSALTKTLESINSHLAPKTPGIADRVKDVSHHIGQEKAATQVSINTHHSD
jgi:type IV secretion system protein TrbL